MRRMWAPPIRLVGSGRARVGDAAANEERPKDDPHSLHLGPHACPMGANS